MAAKQTANDQVVGDDDYDVRAHLLIQAWAAPGLHEAFRIYREDLVRQMETLDPAYSEDDARRAGELTRDLRSLRRVRVVFMEAVKGPPQDDEEENESERPGPEPGMEDTEEDDEPDSERVL